MIVEYSREVAVLGDTSNFKKFGLWLLAIVFVVLSILMESQAGPSVKGVGVILFVILLGFCSIRNSGNVISLKLILIFLLSLMLSTFMYWDRLGYVDFYYTLKYFLFVSMLLSVFGMKPTEFKFFFIRVSVVYACAVPIIIAMDVVYSIYLLLPALLLLKRAALFFVILTLVLYLSYEYVYRGVLFVAVMISVYRILCLKFDVVQRFLFLIPIVLFVVQIYIALKYGYDYEANEFLTKRPFIWATYLDEYSSSAVVNWFFGSGRIDSGVALYVGDVVSEEFGVGRSYTSHSLLINTLIEYGLVGAVLIFFPLLSGTWKKKSEINTLFSLYAFFMILGFVSPIGLLGYSGLSLMYTMLFLFLISYSGSNCNENVQTEV